MPKDEFRKFDAIVSVAGDGIPHEIINGFMMRPDFHELTLNLGKANISNQVFYQEVVAVQFCTTFSRLETWKLVERQPLSWQLV